MSFKHLQKLKSELEAYMSQLTSNNGIIWLQISTNKNIHIVHAYMGETI